MKKQKDSYHHGNLAESLLDAVDEIATQFGIEAVTLRACARHAGVSPSSAFRHYADKRALLTAFATRALLQMGQAMQNARDEAEVTGDHPFLAVGVAYVAFAIDKPAFFRAMWREETIYCQDEDYLAAARQLAGYLQGGFVDTIADDNPAAFSPKELLAWSSVHGLAGLFVDGPVARTQTRDEKIGLARQMIAALAPALLADEGGAQDNAPPE